MKQKILVTGGCGFLGSHVCELFHKRGWNVVSYDNLTKFEYARAGFGSEVRNYNWHFLDKLGVQMIYGDLADLQLLKKHIADCDLVVHCAAQPAMTVSIENPLHDLESNVRGTVNVLEACRIGSNTPVVNCSSIHVYGNAINKSLNEELTRFTRLRGPVPEWVVDPGGTMSPLHASKKAAELYVRAYSETYDLPAASFRLTGMYGPRQFGGEDHGWIANFAIRTIFERPIKIFGTDKQVRDILYVRDATEAFWMWYSSGCPSGVFNVGGGELTAVSIYDVLHRLELLTHKRSPVERLPKRHGDLWWFISNCDKAFKTFKWKPKVTPKDGLFMLVDWIYGERSLFE